MAALMSSRRLPGRAKGMPAWGKVLSDLSLLEHYDTFSKGILDTKDVIYYVNFTVLALFLTLRSLETRRWKG